MAETTTKITPDGRQKVVLVTGPSGAGRSTAVRALEDIGFEVIDNLPLSLLARLLDGPPISRPLAIGLDVRNRDFGIEPILEMMAQWDQRADIDHQLLYLDCDESELVRRYSETRRRHPLAPKNSPLSGIQREREILVPLRARADVLIETTGLSVHDLKSEIGQWFAPSDGHNLSLTIQSFSFKRGLPRGVDIVHDVRFLNNPHWVPDLRALDGRTQAVADYVAGDALHDAFFEKVCDMMHLLLPAYQAEGKSHLSVAFGCTGGKHRSVALTEHLAATLAAQGWRSTIRHRELERTAQAPAQTKEVAK